MTTAFRNPDMRVNARFEGEAEQQLNYLAQATGARVSEVLRASVRHYYEQLRSQQGGLKHFAAFIGAGQSGRGDIAGNYKALLTQDWARKHQGAAHAVHEPSPPWPAQPGKASAQAPAKTRKKRA
jgi:hypothetical protein